MIQNNTFVRSLRAELLKLKSTPILWLSLGGGVLMAGFIFLIFYFNVSKLSANPGNPWSIYLSISYMFTAMLVMVPYVVLLASSVVYPEHDSSAWKRLYALPLKKSNFYFSKLLAILLLVFLMLTLYFVGSILAGYLLDFLLPAYGFRNYPGNFQDFAGRLLHAFLSILAIAALHYWLSVQWKSFILPIGIGLAGFIVAIFLVFFGERFDLAAFFPYTYPLLMGAEFGTDPVGLERMGWLTKVEWYSIALFLIFALGGFWIEARRDVKG